MSCRIERNQDGSIKQVTDIYGSPSVLFKGMNSALNAGAMEDIAYAAYLKATSDFNSTRKEAKRAGITEPTIASPEVSRVLDDVKQNIPHWDTIANDLKLHEATITLEDSLGYFLQKIGVKVKTVETLKDEEGNPVNAMGLADMTNRVIQLANGKADISTLSEEASHFLVEILRVDDNPLYKSMYKLIEQYQEYKDIADPESFYYKKYKGDIDMLKREAIAKIITTHLVNGNNKNETKANVSRLQRWWDRVLSFLGKMFGKTQHDPFVESAMKIFRNDLEKAVNVNPRTAQMTGTFYQDMTVEDTIKMLDEFEGKYEIGKVDIKKLDSKDLKKYFTKLVGDDPTIERYVGVKGGPYEGTTLKLRASDAASLMYKDKGFTKYMTEEKRLSQEKNSATRMKVGTSGHTIMEGLANLVFNRKGSLSAILTTAGSTFKEEHVKRMHKAMKLLKKSLDEQQNIIDPKKSYVVRPEQFVSDEAQGLGGTIDLLVLFSDNSASMYDYKFKSATYKHSNYSKASQKLEIIGDMFADSLEGYDSQLGGYRDTLLSKYGVTKIRQSRIIPAGIKYKTDDNGDLTETIEGFDIFDGTNSTTALEHIPVAAEQTGDKNIDALIAAEMRRFKKMATKLKHTPFKDKEPLQIKMATSRQIIKDLQLHQNVLQGLTEANRLVARANVGAGVEDRYITVKDKQEFNPKYLTDTELLNLYNDLNHFRSFTELYEIRKELEKNPTNKNKKLLASLDLASGNIGTTLKLLEDSIINRLDLKAREKGIKNFKYNRKMSAVNQYVNISSHSSPYSRYMHETMNTINGAALRFEKALAAEIKEQEIKLSSGAYSLNEAYLELINPVTHNLHAKYNNDFYTEKEKAITEGKIDWMKKHYSIDEEYYKKEFASWRKDTFNRIDKSYPKATEAARQAKDAWEKKYDVKKYDSAWLDAGGRYFTKINEQTTGKFITPAFKKIMKTPELKEFYDFYTAKIHDFEKRFGMNLGHTFIPNVHKGFLDSLLESDKPWDVFTKSVANAFKTREHDMEYAQYDTDGAAIRHIPRLYTAELKSEDEFGNQVVDRSLRSTELGRSLYLLGQAAIQYELKHEVEDELLLIERLLKDNFIETIGEDPQGNAISEGFGKVRTMFNAGQSNAESFTDLIDKTLYNINIKGKDMISGTNISFNKSMLALKTFHSIAALGLKTPVAIGAFGAGMVGLNVQGTKGIHITKQGVREAEMAYMARDPKVRAIMEYFQVAVLDESKRRGELLASTVRGKYMTGDRWFEFLAQADKAIDTMLVIAMAKNHGIGKDGDLYRLNELPEGTESLWDSMEIEENENYTTGVTDKYKTTIKGMKDNSFNDFRARISTMSTKIKGASSPEAINTAGMKIINRFFLHYRSWLPGLALERFGTLRYDHTMKHFDQGTQRGFWGNFGPDEAFDDMGQVVTAEYALHEYAGAIMADTARIALDIATFGLTKSYTVKEGKARLQFDEFLADQVGNEEFEFKTKEDKEKAYEQFLEMKRGNLRAALAELRAIALLMATLMMMGGDWDDDGKIDMRQSYAGRKIYNIFGRIYRETAVFWDLTELTGPRASGIPLLGLGQDGIKWVRNSFDEFWDRVLGRQGVEKNDRVELGYYTWKFAPGLGGLVKALEIYPQHKQARR
jgi:hypothetical protein